MAEKMCIFCKKIKDLSQFSKNKNSKDGLKSYCKKCASEKNKIYREKNKDKITEANRQWYNKSKLKKEERTQKELEKGYRVCTICNKKKPISEYYKRGNGGFYAECKECQLKKQNEYHWNNRDKILERKRAYNARVKEKYKTYFKDYYKDNKQKIINRVNRWKKDNPEKFNIQRITTEQRRRARKRKLENNFSKNDWEICKDYFRDNNGVLRCAYCGKELKRATQEHFIPISKGGNYIKSNILPVCLSCNSSKKDKDFEEWYLEQDFYSNERKEKIYTYLNKYADTVPNL